MKWSIILFMLHIPSRLKMQFLSNTALHVEVDVMDYEGALRIRRTEQKNSIVKFECNYNVINMTFLLRRHWNI
jgi:hypothetical protein